MRLVRMSALGAIPLLSFLSARGTAFSEPGIDVLRALVFGPAPAALLGDSQGRYMWVIGEVENALASTTQVEVALTMDGAPDGCQQMTELILPGEPSFELAAGERRWILYRLRFECRSPADAGTYALPLSLCAGEQGQAPSHCWTGTRQLVTGWGGTYMGVDVDAWGNTRNLAGDLGSLESCGSVQTGDTFDVDLYITEIEDLLAWAGYLEYEPDVLRVVDIDVWQLQGTNPMSLVKFFGDDIPDGDGSFEAIGIDMGPTSAGDSGTGVLARITLEAIGPGVSPLTITEPEVVNEWAVHLGDTNGDGYFDGPILNAQVAVDEDPDGDGLATPCGDPVADNPDADGDGMSDSVEVEVGSDPLDPSQTPILETECPQGEEPVYDDDGNFMGCYSGLAEVKVCDPQGLDFDGDGSEDSCDSDPVDPDADGDTVPDPFEAYVGTDPRDSCSDDPLDPAWPFDINTDTWADDADIQLFYTSGAYGTQHGDDAYNRRYDIDADGAINDQDIELYTDAGVLGTQCSESQGQQGQGLEAALAERQAVLEGGGVAAAVTLSSNWPPFNIYYARHTDNARHRLCWTYWPGHQVCGTGYSLKITQGWYFTSTDYIFAYDVPEVSATAKFIYCLTNDRYWWHYPPVWVHRTPIQARRTDAYLSWTSPPFCYCRTDVPFEMGGCPAYFVSSNKLTFRGDGSYSPSHWGF